jgi:hypothetical protein
MAVGEHRDRMAVGEHSCLSPSAAAGPTEEEKVRKRRRRRRRSEGLFAVSATPCRVTPPLEGEEEGTTGRRRKRRGKKEKEEQVAHERWR